MRRELDRVAQQVADYLLEAFLIGQHERRLFRLAIADANILAGDHRAELVDHDLDERVHARRLQVEHHASRFEFRQIEQIVDEVQKGLGAAADVVEEFPQLAAVARCGLFDAETRVTQNAVQRRAQLVRDVRQELALGAIGRFGRVALVGDHLRKGEQLRLGNQQGVRIQQAEIAIAVIDENRFIGVLVRPGQGKLGGGVDRAARRQLQKIGRPDREKVPDRLLQKQLPAIRPAEPAKKRVAGNDSDELALGQHDHSGKVRPAIELGLDQVGRRRRIDNIGNRRQVGQRGICVNRILTRPVHDGFSGRDQCRCGKAVRNENLREGNPAWKNPLAKSSSGRRGVARCSVGATIFGVALEVARESLPTKP